MKREAFDTDYDEFIRKYVGLQKQINQQTKFIDRLLYEHGGMVRMHPEFSSEDEGEIISNMNYVKDRLADVINYFAKSKTASEKTLAKSKINRYFDIEEV